MIHGTEEVDNRIDLERGIVTLPMRQMEAIRWLLCGYTQCQIAEKMGVTQQTVQELLEKSLDRLKPTCI